tara:strand:+ start:36447 stop:37190 length:744 start_codon:yes stop_codon:yes gene_type:complete
MVRITLFMCLCFLVACNISKKKSKVNEQSHNSGVLSETSKDGEWIILFDGTSLDNWKGYLSETVYPEWNIKDSILVFTPGKEGGKNIITKKRYTNFILSLEWKISEAGNSGIFWGVYENEKFIEAYMTGPEIQVLDNDKHPDSFVGNGIHKAGSLYDMIGYPEEYIKPAGEWNKCVIEVNHKINKANITMNEKTTISFPLNGVEWENMVSNSKFKDWEGFGKYKTGHIGLQDHSDQVSFRDIKIQEL